MFPFLSLEVGKRPRGIVIDVKEGDRYSVTAQVWPDSTSHSQIEQKAALLLVEFLDPSGTGIAAPKLGRTKDGDSYAYISYEPGKPVKRTILAPPGAVQVRLSLRPWKLKDITGEIISARAVDGVTGSSRVAQNIVATRDLAQLAYPSMTKEEADDRFYFEAMLAERSRRKFEVEPMASPDRADLLSSAEFELARDYVERRGPKGQAPRHLVISTSYPDEGNRYANAFVHQRVKAYERAGVEVDVIAFARGMKRRIWNFEGVDVVGGYVNELITLLELGAYTSVSVHFMHPHMLAILDRYSSKHDIHFVIHGHEVRNWSRGFDFSLGLEAAAKEKLRTDVSKDVWKAVVENDIGASYIFVSEWMKQAAQDDTEVLFPTHRTHVIHNPIDTDTFQFREKCAEHATKILIIRNFDKHVYATDLVHKTLLDLKARAIWNDLTISVYGTGKRLADLQRDFVDDRNVLIEPRYLSHEEISDAHARHGIFLIPSRLDSQGVSRSEAMASGLVPATNRVAAIPEFVDDDCAILAPPEDHEALADGIEMLAQDPTRFITMSAAAAARIRAQCRQDDCIEQEMKVLGLWQ